MIKHEEAFDPRHYWEQRLQAHPDITGVGYFGRSSEFVERQYHSRKRQVELALRHYGIADLKGRSVLDIGSGTGIWLDFWHQYGSAHVAGIDFAQPSVDRLKVRFPDDLIIHADVSVAPLPLPATMRFDIISAFDVFLHIVDPEGFRRTVANLAYHCSLGGWLIISDAIVLGQGYVPNRSYAIHSKVRTVEDYREVLTAHGFAIDSIWPTTVLLNNPLEAPNHLTFLALLGWWRATELWGRYNLITRLIGPGVYKIDQIVCRLCSDGKSPTSKLMFARKLE